MKYRLGIIAILILDLILSILIIDFSSDGATYHVIAINELVSKINPYSFDL